MPDRMTSEAAREDRSLDVTLEEGLEETFPASDPPTALRRAPEEPPKPA